MTRRNLYSSSPKDSRCECGGVFVDTNVQPGQGHLPNGDSYRFVIAVEKKCGGCGRNWRKQEPAKE